MITVITQFLAGTSPFIFAVWAEIKVDSCIHCTKLAMVCVLFLWEHVTLREKDSFRYPKCGWLSEGENMNYCHSMNMTAGLKIFKPFYCSQRRTTTNIAYTHGWFFTWPEGNKFWFQMYQAGFKGLNSGFTYRTYWKITCSRNVPSDCYRMFKSILHKKTSKLSARCSEQSHGSGETR